MQKIKSALSLFFGGGEERIQLGEAIKAINYSVSKEVWDGATEVLYFTCLVRPESF